MRLFVPDELKPFLRREAENQGVSPSRLMTSFVIEILNINSNSPTAAKDHTQNDKQH